MDLASGPANNTGLQLSLDLGASSPTDELAVATAQKPLLKRCFSRGMCSCHILGKSKDSLSLLLPHLE